MFLVFSSSSAWYWQLSSPDRCQIWMIFMLIVADCICQKSKWVRGEMIVLVNRSPFLSYRDGRLAHPFILVMLLSEAGCRRVMSTPVKPGAVCLSLNDRIVESIYTQGQINFSHSIPCVTVSLSSHTENPYGIFLQEDLTIFLSSPLIWI